MTIDVREPANSVMADVAASGYNGFLTDGTRPGAGLTGSERREYHGLLE